MEDIPNGLQCFQKNLSTKKDMPKIRNCNEWRRQDGKGDSMKNDTNGRQLLVLSRLYLKTH